MSDLVRIRFEESTEVLPCMLRVQFSPITWNMAFKMRDLLPLDDRLKKKEAFDCIHSFLRMMEKELIAALPEHLK